jgi:hypothetical protein
MAPETPWGEQPGIPGERDIRTLESAGSSVTAVIV